MTYETYSAYRSSGEQWLKRVPSHWSVEKISHHCQLIGSGTTPSASDPIYYDGDINWVTTSELREKPIGETKNKITDEALNKYSSLKFYPAGSVIIAMYGATIGRLGWLAQAATVNQACCVYANSTRLSQRYIFYWLLAVRNELIAFASGGGQKNLNQEFLRSIKTFVPPMSEQEKITSFLDRKTAEIDGLIARKRRLLALLAEKRTALITRAVTKGLNPDARMKDSGIEWLGEIPVHWDVMPVRRLASPVKNAIKVGPFGNQLVLSEMLAGHQDFLVFNQRSVLDKDFSNEKYTISEDKFNELCSFEVFPRDLLVSTRGTIGRCAVAPMGLAKGVLHPCLMRVRLDESRVLPEFMESLIEDSPIAIEQLKLASNSTTIDVIYSSTLKAVKVPVPPVEEQQKILSTIESYSNGINGVLRKVKLVISALEEYRSTLITNAVTGQIKVA